MMKKIKVISFLSMALLGCGTASAQQSNAAAIERPKLVVGIVVDQMRWDYLYRYQKRYTDGGFKRLLGATPASIRAACPLYTVLLATTL